MTQQGSADGCEDDRARSTRAIEYRASDGCLKPGDLLADGRLRVAEDIGRTSEGPFLRDRAQGLKVAHLVARGV